MRLDAAFLSATLKLITHSAHDINSIISVDFLLPGRDIWAIALETTHSCSYKSRAPEEMTLQASSPLFELVRLDQSSPTVQSWQKILHQNIL